jgi:hypothetical protein
MQKWLTLGLCLLAGTLTAGSAAADTLVIGTGDTFGNGGPNFVASEIDTYYSGLVGWVDAQSSTPGSGLLNAYDSVLVYNYPGADFDNPAALGDVLYDYVLGGGNVVSMMYTFFSSYPLGGDWSTNGFDPITPGSAFDSADFEAVMPSSPASEYASLFTGVGDFDGRLLASLGTGSVKSGATTVAWWEDTSGFNPDYALVVDRNVRDMPGNPGTWGNVVGLNYNPLDFMIEGTFQTSTDPDAMRLIANALGAVEDPAFGRIVNGGGPGDVPIPEPATLTLLGVGLAGLAARRVRRK